MTESFGMGSSVEWALLSKLRHHIRQHGHRLCPLHRQLLGIVGTITREAAASFLPECGAQIVASTSP